MQGPINRRNFLVLAAQSTALAVSEGQTRASDSARWRQNGAAVEVTFGESTLRIEPFIEGIVRVRIGSSSAMRLPNKSLAVLREPDRDLSATVKEAAGEILVTAAGLTASIDLATQIIQYRTPDGVVLLTDAGPGSAEAAVRAGDVSRRFTLTQDEAIYGLGQYRNGVLNWRGHAIDMVQVNTQAAIPLLLSTRGYGLFWNNPSRTTFEDRDSGTYFRSEHGPYVEYFVIAGPKFDDVIRRYRALTGPVPMIPRWALGYVQSRNRYQAQEEVLSVVRKQRSLHLPIDSIFIDYYYWGDKGFGSDVFDPTAFPDPKAMVAELHSMHTRLIVSVWPTFSAGSAHYQKMSELGYLLEGTSLLGAKVYDAFNPAARKLYWSFLVESLVPVGVDGWFMDSSEPDAKGFTRAMTALGPASEVENQYSLAHTTAVYEGLRQQDPNKRVFIITRSAFAGQQRNAAADWSGDIDTTFLELSLQVPAGLNFAMAGIPYWTTDIGGYLGGDPENVYYRELFIRWWQFGTFCPLFRAHGRREPFSTRKAPNELWAYGEEVVRIAAKFAYLRYRLLPYLYSLAARVTQDGYTIMRALVFDFPEDVSVRDLATQFMFGPSLLISPVLGSGARSRSVYLPKQCDWIDFWTGQTHKGGSTLHAAALLDSMPIMVRAGSILLMGPPAEHTGAVEDPIEVRIYPGRDADFSLYEDDGETYGCNRGEFTTILFSWREVEGSLTIGARKGSYSAKLQHRTFAIVWVSSTQGLGSTESTSPRVVEYDGSKRVVQR